MTPGASCALRLSPRLIGLLTAAYGAGVAARPHWLTRPCELTGEQEEVPPGLGALVTAVGVRDAASGLALLAAPRSALATVIALRLAADVGDAAALGTALPSPRARRKASGAAAAWGALTALSALGARADG